ncbi:MAG: Molybdopterin-guanine dinucleotide biosynthesis protein MobA [Ignavibacteriae bacterium]|nr:MAG: Molybdopterin-guanine dinucleotide biosynthesis protein MobA [Ignavibacteriota bacterium]
MYKDITGIILAGGKSRRMGEDKALIKILDLTAIEIVYEKLKSLFYEILVITNQPDKFSFLNVKAYEDVYRNIGPLAGIHSGLAHSSNKFNFFISCDMVLMKKEIIEFIVNRKFEKNIIVPRVYDTLQPLCAVYSKNCISTIESMIEANIRSNQLELNSPLRLIEVMDTEIVEITQNQDNYFNPFFSMNDKKDYQKVIDIFLSQQYL